MASKKRLRRCCLRAALSVGEREEDMMSRLEEAFWSLKTWYPT